MTARHRSNGTWSLLSYSVVDGGENKTFERYLLSNKPMNHITASCKTAS